VEKIEYINIDEIIVKDNVRKDYGDLTELTESIKQYGVRKPLELNSMKELVDGFRRLKAAKIAGLKSVPFFFNDNTIENVIEQILSGTLSKNINPVEEGNAFVKYMADEKIQVKEMAKKISKSEGYVQKRIEIATLPKEIKDELIAGRIEIGHALLLKKMPDKDAKNYLKEILRDKMSVQDARDHAQYIGRLTDAKFDKTMCKGCRFNGSEQSELFETGKVLNGICLNKGCYVRKMQEYVKKLKVEYKDVIFKGENEYSRPKGYEKDYDSRITKKYADECRKTRTNYLVIINDKGELDEYFKLPVQKVSEQPEKVQKQVREKKLESKVEDFKTAWLIRKCQETIKPGTKEAKALALLEMDSSNDVKKTFELSEKEIDKKIATQAISALMGMGMKDLLIATSMNGVDIKTQFQITEEFLNLYTKDQLFNLMEELKITGGLEKGETKESLIKFILTNNLKGKVPKILI
jgi:ParB family chromosome partitioning protein